MPVGWMGWLTSSPARETAKPRGTQKRRAAAKSARKARRRSR